MFVLTQMPQPYEKMKPETFVFGKLCWNSSGCNQVRYKSWRTAVKPDFRQLFFDIFENSTHIIAGMDSGLTSHPLEKQNWLQLVGYNDSTCNECNTYRHSLSSMQAVNCSLRFCMAGKLDKGTACAHKNRQAHHELQGKYIIYNHCSLVIWFVNILDQLFVGGIKP